MNNNQIQPTNPIKSSRFHLKTWQWVSVLAVMAVIVAGVFVFWNRGTQISPQVEYEQRMADETLIKQSIKEANYCRITDDCVLLGEYCPFSNSWETYVNKAEKEKMQKMIEDFQKKAPPTLCKPSICHNVSPVQCVEDKCYVECRDETITQNKCEGLTEDECRKDSNCSPHIIIADPIGPQYAGCLEKTPTQRAEEKGDYTFCDQEEEEQPKWWCYILVAEKDKDLSICDKIKDEKRLQQCYQAVQKETGITENVSITIDKTEYEQGETVKITVKNNLDESICFGHCHAYYLEKKNLGWEAGSMPICETDFIEECLKPSGTKAFKEKTVGQGIYRAVFPICVGCEISEDFKRVQLIYSNEFTIKQEKELSDINKLPIISDCRKTADKENFKDEEPTQKMIENINKKAFILQNFKIRSGCKIGRIRAERHGLPAGYNCLSYFDVGVLKCDVYPGSCVLNKGQLLSRSELPEAFMLEEKDLKNIGWLLYGDLIDREMLLEKYNQAAKENLCSESKTGFDCNEYKIKELPEFKDGEITLKNSKSILHRYGLGGCGPDDCLYHCAISVAEDGSFKIEKEEIYYIRSGIMW